MYSTVTCFKYPAQHVHFQIPISECNTVTPSSLMTATCGTNQDLSTLLIPCPFLFKIIWCAAVTLDTSPGIYKLNDRYENKFYGILLRYNFVCC